MTTRVESEVLDTQTFSALSARFVFPRRGVLDCTKSYLLMQVTTSAAATAANAASYHPFIGGHALIQSVRLQIGGVEVCNQTEHPAWRLAVQRAPSMAVQKGMQHPFDRSVPGLRIAADGVVQADGLPLATRFLDETSILTELTTTSPKVAIRLSDLHPFFRAMPQLPIGSLRGAVELEIGFNQINGISFDSGLGAGARTYTIHRPQMRTEIYHSDEPQMDGEIAYTDVYASSTAVAAGADGVLQQLTSYHGLQNKTLGALYLVKQISVLPLNLFSFWVPAQSLQVRLGGVPVFEVPLTNQARQFAEYRKALDGPAPIPKGLFDGTKADVLAQDGVRASQNVLGVDLAGRDSGNTPIQVDWSRTPTTAANRAAFSLKTLITYRRTLRIKDGVVMVD